MVVTKIASREDFNKLNETPLVEHVIIPLLQKQGMRDVRNNHGVTELGKDIVCWYQGPMGDTVNVVIVAKKGNISKTVAKEVARQVRQAFNTSFATGLDSIERTADSVWVVTNGSIAELSRNSIRSEVGREFQDEVRWLDGNEL